MEVIYQTQWTKQEEMCKCQKDAIWLHCPWTPTEFNYTCSNFSYFPAGVVVTFWFDLWVSTAQEGLAGQGGVAAARAERSGAGWRGAARRGWALPCSTAARLAAAQAPARPTRHSSVLLQLTLSCVGRSSCCISVSTLSVSLVWLKERYLFCHLHGRAQLEFQKQKDVLSSSVTSIQELYRNKDAFLCSVSISLME